MTDITTRLLFMSEAMYMDRDQDELDALLLEAKGYIERLRAQMLSAAAICDGWAVESEGYGWSTHQVRQNRELAAKLRAALIPQQKGNAS